MKKILACFLILLFVISITPVFSQEVEPNNDKQQADRVQGRTINGFIGYPGDVDWFVLSGQEGTNPTFTIYHAPNVDFDFEVYSDHQSVARATGTSSGDSTTCYVPGRCFVRVWSCHGTGSYQITFTGGGGGHHHIPPPPPQGDDREPNNQSSDASSVSDMTISGSINYSGDTDWYRLNGQEGSNPTFTIEHMSGIDVDFEVYSNGMSVGSATGSFSGNSITCNVPGSCSIRVWGCGGCTGGYVIRIRRGHVQPPPPVVDVEYEPNNDRSQANRISGMAINGFIAYPGDTDWYQLSGQEGGRPTFVIEHGPHMDVDFEVYSNGMSAGTALGSRSGDAITCNVPGSCMIRVWAAHGTGQYRIRIMR